MRLTILVVVALLGFWVAGCGTNRTIVYEDVTLTQIPPATTQASGSRQEIELVRVEQDGTAILHWIRPDRVLKAKPGQTVQVEKGIDYQRNATVISSDPASQQATVRIEVIKRTRPEF